MSKQSAKSSLDISESIKVFIRQRPEVTDNEVSTDIDLQRERKSGVHSVASDGKSCTYYSSTNKTDQKFVVDRYFEPATQQDELFDVIAKPIVDSALLGYSGTILAYGPTSSGKTHTMRGGNDNMRGIMPR